MQISYTEKPKQRERSLGRGVNQWPDEAGTIWRVVRSDLEKFKEGDLLLYLCSQYSGYAWINLRDSTVHTSEIKDGHNVKIVQDFTLNTVTLYVDNSARP